MDLRAAVRSRGRVVGDLLMVDEFLNHRVEPDVMEAVGRQLADVISPTQADLLLTAEASGIPPALLAATRMGLPMVYAKKYVGPGERYTFSREVRSPTKTTEYRVEVARRVLAPGLRVAIIDDFLAGGRTAEALGEIVEEAGSEVAIAVFVIEKAFTTGRHRLERHGWPVSSLVTVTSLAGGTVTLGP